MPAIVIHSIEMTDKQKAIVAEKFISTMSEVTGVPKDRIYLFFNGYGLNEAATGGKLFSENPPKILLKTPRQNSMPTNGRSNYQLKVEN